MHRMPIVRWDGTVSETLVTRCSFVFRRVKWADVRQERSAPTSVRASSNPSASAMVIARVVRSARRSFVSLRRVWATWIATMVGRASRTVASPGCSVERTKTVATMDCGAINNQCIAPGGCMSDDECPPPQSCIAGLCFSVPPRECDVDGDCAEGERCELGFCEPSTTCRITSDCPPDQVCIDEVCRFDIECVMDADCDPGERCDERGQCVLVGP